MKSYANKYIEGKKYSQDELIPIVVLILGANGGKAAKKYVEEKVYELFREQFKADLYHEKVANSSVPRWKHDIAWARERAKQIYRYIEVSKFSERGVWELSPEGKLYYEQLIEDIKKAKNVLDESN